VNVNVSSAQQFLTAHTHKLCHTASGVSMQSGAHGKI